MQFFSDQASFASTQPQPAAVSIAVASESSSAIAITCSPGQAAPVTIAAPPGQAFSKFGCTVISMSDAVDTVVVTEDGARETHQITGPRAFFGVEMGNSRITQLIFSDSFKAGFSVSGIVASSANLPADPVTYPSLAEFQQQFPTAQHLDFSAANMPADAWPRISSPINANTNNGMFAPGMIPTGIEFRCNDSTGLRSVNVGPAWSGQFPSWYGKAIAAASGDVHLIVAFLQPVRAAAITLCELGGTPAHYICTVTGSTGWTTQATIPGPAIDAQTVVVSAVGSPIAAIDIVRDGGELSYGISNVSWQAAG